MDMTPRWGFVRLTNSLSEIYSMLRAPCPMLFAALSSMPYALCSMLFILIKADITSRAQS